MPKTKNKAEFDCDFCDKSFTRESSLMVHCCVKKMRYLDKDNKNSVMAYVTYRRFFELSGLRRKEITFKTFIESTMYNDFMRFGKWLNDANIINPQAYADYLIKGSFKIKDWTKESVYQGYLKSYLFQERPMDGVERTLLWIQQLCAENSIPLEKFFETISTNRIVDMLRNGKLSPWLFIVCENSVKLLDRFDSSQHKLLGDLLDTKIWTLKIKKHGQEVKECREILEGLKL